MHRRAGRADLGCVRLSRPLTLHLLAIAAASLAAALSAAPAQAVLVKLPRGGYANLAPMAGAATPTAAHPFDSAFSNLDYNGGPVMPTNTNYAIVWAPSGYGGTPFQPGYTAGVARFFTDLAAASGGSGNSDSVSTQYRDAAGESASYSSSFGGTYTDTDPLPANLCPAASGHICLTDSELQTELDTFLSAQGLPADLAHEYFLLTPPSVASCIDAAGTECSANADQNQYYCAYHSISAGNHVYANIPDLAGVPGCDPFVTGCPASSCAYDNGPADGTVSAISHEHNESITDPEPNTGWTDMQPGCTPSSPVTCGGEIGDKCVGGEFSDPNLQLQNNGVGQDTPYNQTINGDHYLLQAEWSNAGRRCLDGYLPGSTYADAAFTDSPGAGTTFDFDASKSMATGGVAEYVWQFNDAGTVDTIETASPTISHTFPSSGNYQVALTVLAGDGTSGASAATIDVGAASSPIPSFTASIAPPTVSFDATGSSDPNAGGAITSYSWNFGDGTTGTGAAPTHTYSAARLYTVTLTVSDTAGLTNTYSRTVDLAGPPPTAAFSVGTARAGSPTPFDGSASTATGGISLYRWSFGDGSSATGAAASHIYATPGTYLATLTVYGADGESAMVVHSISVLPSGPPVAAFSAGAPDKTGRVQFNGASSTAPLDDWLVSYAWSFGDGATATGARPSHAFSVGRHTVTLTVRDAFGQSTSIAHVVTIAHALPRVSLRTRAGRARTISFTVHASDPGARIVSYRWRFGDGAISRSRSPSHRYRRAGIYTVRLVVSDSAGATVTVTCRITVGGRARRGGR